MQYVCAQTNTWLEAVTERIDRGWRERMQSQWSEAYFCTLRTKLAQEASEHSIVPSSLRLFRALTDTPYEAVRVVLVGQDPYHGPRQANGLCFAVDPEMTPPPSLRIILHELGQDMRLPTCGTVDMSLWAQAGVLMINTIWTTRQGVAGAHRRWGWELWTEQLFRQLNAHPRRLVFLLWGKHAQQWRTAIDATRHALLCAPHPSPLSAYRGFIGSRPFSQTNAWLEALGERPIDWRIQKER